MSVIKDVLITEKSLALASRGCYVFLVDEKSNKMQIAQAVKEQFGVLPVSVNIAVLPRKSISRGKVSGKRTLRKKAFVTLKKGQKIDILEFAKTEEKKEGPQLKKEKRGLFRKKTESKGPEIKVVKREEGKIKV